MMQIWYRLSQVQGRARKVLPQHCHTPTPFRNQARKSWAAGDSPVIQRHTAPACRGLRRLHSCVHHKVCARPHLAERQVGAAVVDHVLQGAGEQLGDDAQVGGLQVRGQQAHDVGVGAPARVLGRTSSRMMWGGKESWGGGKGRAGWVSVGVKQRRIQPQGKARQARQAPGQQRRGAHTAFATAHVRRTRWTAHQVTLCIPLYIVHPQTYTYLRLLLHIFTSTHSHLPLTCS